MSENGKMRKVPIEMSILREQCFSELLTSCCDGIELTPVNPDGAMFHVWGGRTELGGWKFG